MITVKRYDLKNQTYTATLKFGKLEAKGEYNLAGKFLGQPMNRTGDFNGTAAETLIDIVLYTKLVKKNNVDYMKVTDSKIDIKIGKASGNFANLFGDIEILSE